MTDRNKFGNEPTERDNITFASKVEAQRYSELKLLFANGDILYLVAHPKFSLQDKFTTRFGQTVRAITYTADFKYFDVELQRFVVEDVKSEITRKEKAFRIKFKLAQKLYPDFEFREVIL